MENKGQPFDGIEAVVGMLQTMSAEEQEKLLSDMSQRDPEMVKKIRERLFTFADLVKVDKETMLKILKEAPAPDIALALRAASDELKNHFYSFLSQRGQDMLKEEVENGQPRPLKEVEAAQKRILTIVKQG
jgi:flagellar motor switch protein FliG